MARSGQTVDVTVSEVIRREEQDGTERVILVTNRGQVESRLQRAGTGDAGVVWVFGAGGGLGGPAGGLYPRLGRQLLPSGVTSLEVAYRYPGDLTECVLDVLLGVAYLTSLGRTRIVLVGHSFGGAVVITAGAVSDQVVAVAALSSQSAGTESVAALTPRPLLLVHGTADEILPDSCSRDIYARAREPRTLLLYPGCRHGLDGCGDELDRDLAEWIRNVVGASRG